MQVLYGPNFKIGKPTVVTIGKFDGLHKGHMKVLNKLLSLADKNELDSVVYTFNINPKIVLKHEQFMPLMTNEEKIEKMSNIGVDYLVYEEFDMKFADMMPEEFVRTVLIGKLNTKILVMGENSTFGKDRRGDTALMKSFGDKYGFKVVVVELLKEGGDVISSTRIRQGVIL